MELKQLCLSSGAAAVKSGGSSPLRGSAGTGQQPVQVVIKDSPIILAQVSTDSYFFLGFLLSSDFIAVKYASKCLV